MSTRNVLITGASTGIGRACALHLAGEGWRVFGGVRKDADAASLTEASSGAVTPVRCDVTQADSVSEAIATIEDAIGSSGALHGLVNNAGIAAGGPLEFLDIEELQRVLDVNVVGQLRMLQAALPMLRRGPGRVVNISSLAGRVVMPFFGPYAASKHALEALSDAMRRELAPWNIEVAVVQPGAIQTPIWDKGREAGEAVREQLPEKATALYLETLERVQSRIDRSSQKAVPAERVSKAVLHALSAKRPRTRYRVGPDAHVLMTLAMLLPDRVLDRIIAKIL